MRKEKFFIVIVFFLQSFFASFSSPALSSEKIIKQDQGPVLKVGLLTNQSGISISSDMDFQLIDGDSRHILKEEKSKAQLIVNMKNGQFYINNKSFVSVHSILIAAAGENNDHSIEVNGKPYRGNIELHRSKNMPGFTVVNHIPMELYLYGILSQEISSDWPIEALKAQAVAARTYALYNRGKHSEDGFDICSTSDCQVYRGIEAETVRTNKAVDETKGIVLIYQGKPISAVFHSSSGGFTENSENVWGTALPYLRGVEDMDQDSPYYRWERRFSVAEFIRNFSSYTPAIGKPDVVVLSALTPPAKTNGDRGVSGRVKTLRLIGDKGSIQLTGNQIRSILNLPSTMFDVKMDSEIRLKNDFKGTTHRLTDEDGNTVVVTGYGWGHGVGLSQWGAKAMAERNAKGDNAYYKKILRHYYTGVDIQKYY